MTFPLIKTDDALRELLGTNKQFKFIQQPNGTTVCCYVVADSHTFDDPLACEGRGITFDGEHDIVGRPLHKFFNVDERPETKFEKLDWSKAIRAMVKMDGSMIHTVKIQSNGWHHVLKSKKSFDSSVVKDANEWLEKNISYRMLCEWCVNRNYTAIFEWTSPQSRIVVPYKEPGLTLLHIRDNEYGFYLEQDVIASLANTYNVNVVKMDETVLALCHDDPKQLLQLVKSVEGLEGWVIQFENGEMVKLKTKWYLDRHGLYTFRRECDLAELALEEKLDDMKSTLLHDGMSLVEIERIEARVAATYSELVDEVESMFVASAGKQRKDVALEYGPSGKNAQTFGLLMAKLSGKEPNYKEFYKKHRLEKFFTNNHVKMQEK